MKIHEIHPKHNQKNNRRIGRGHAGKGGKTGGRGAKGQKARSGHNIPTGFEGGQTKFYQRLPKVGGFKSKKIKNTIIKTSQINTHFEKDDIVSPKTLFEKKLISTPSEKVKILYDKDLKFKIKIKNCLFVKKIKDYIIN